MDSYRKTSGVLYATPRWYSYGGMFESIFLSVNLARYYGKKVLFFYPRNHFDPRYRYSGFLNRELFQIVVDEEILSNRSLFQRIVSKWLELNRWLFRPNHVIAKIVHHFVPPGVRKKMFPYYFGYCGLEYLRDISRHLGISERVDWEKVLENAVPIDLTGAQEQRGERILRDMGVPVGSQFVCLYVRDAGFESKRKINSRGIPDADIADFGLLISYLEVQGFYVIRVGDPTAASCTGGGDKFIDYVHTGFYCELMDLFLHRYCAFWVGTMGGARYVPMAYGRSCVVVNGVYMEYAGNCVNCDDVFMPKHVYSKSQRRFLSLREQLERIDEIDEAHIQTSQEYVVVDNTPQENLTAVSEFYQSKIVGNFSWNLDLQDKFYNLRRSCIREAFYDEASDEWKTINHAKYNHVRPYISQQFLENCWEETDYLANLSGYFARHNTLRGFCPDQEG